MTLRARLLQTLQIAAAATALAGAAKAQNLQLGFVKNGGSTNVQVGASLNLGKGIILNTGLDFGDRRRHEVREYRERLRQPSYFWVAGHYETVCRQVWVEGCWRDVWVDAVYETRIDHCGRVIRVCVRPGYWTRVQDAGHFETREVQVWVDGHYECR